MVRTRLGRTEWYLKVAYECALRSTCLRRQYGAVIVDKDGYIISTGYNGAPKKVIDCLDRDRCWRIEHNIPAGQNYERCYSVHAEMNALMQAGKLASGSTMFLAGVDSNTGLVPESMMPCSLCAKLLVNADIKNVMMMMPNTTYIENPLKYTTMQPIHIWELRELELLS